MTPHRPRAARVSSRTNRPRRRSCSKRPTSHSTPSSRIKGRAIHVARGIRSVRQAKLASTRRNTSPVDLDLRGSLARRNLREARNVESRIVQVGSHGSGTKALQGDWIRCQSSLTDVDVNLHLHLFCAAAAPGQRTEVMPPPSARWHWRNGRENRDPRRDGENFEPAETAD